ncbi:hypothetical protein BaRGS_00016754 [Batillaria attramentaria]|uniref:Uncharacterized protein n=1 Tax=Batillaria attramentaria TaxID=370345 RepID=A0ABD0KYB5_9CAEN
MSVCQRRGRKGADGAISSVKIAKLLQTARMTATFDTINFAIGGGGVRGSGFSSKKSPHNQNKKDNTVRGGSVRVTTLTGQTEAGEVITGFYGTKWRGKYSSVCLSGSSKLTNYVTLDTGIRGSPPHPSQPPDAHPHLNPSTHTLERFTGCKE